MPKSGPSSQEDPEIPGVPRRSQEIRDPVTPSHSSRRWYNLVGGWARQPSEKWWSSSVGMMTWPQLNGKPTKSYIENGPYLVPWFSHKTWWFSIAKNNNIKKKKTCSKPPTSNKSVRSCPVVCTSTELSMDTWGTHGDPGGHESKSRCFLFPSPGYDMLWYFRKMAGKKVRYSRKFDDSWWLKHENGLQMTILWWFLASTLVTHLHFSQKMRSI